MTEYLGVAHWQGCYFKSDRPFLLDGADEVSRLGSKIIKVSEQSLGCTSVVIVPQCWW